MKVFTEIVKTIGNTPMLEIPATPRRGPVVIKLEGFNPGGSVKDRIAESMLRDALMRGLVNEDTVLIEATSGNTGIGMAMAAASLKVPLLLVMPETMSIERRKLLLAYGAQLVLTPGPKGMKGAIEKVNELKAADSRYLHLDQFGNPANPRIHYETTGPEILEALKGRIDALVVGVGTGGTITGAGSFLKGRVKGIQLVAVEPALSPVLSGGNPGPHPIMGIGAGFVPAVLDTKLLDRIITVEAEDARGTARMLAGDYGLLTGISGGAAVWAALEMAKELGPGSTVVTVAPDTGERYLSTDLFPAQEA